jgi:predicted nucleic acid-binding protein
MLCVVDSSVWIDFFRGKLAEESKFLSYLIRQGADLAYTGVILTEVLMGFKKEEDLKVAKGLFQNLIYLESNAETYIQASEIYRKARKHGITIRSTIDCIIAAIVLQHGSTLLENDKDFIRIAKFCDLKLISRIPKVG